MLVDERKRLYCRVRLYKEALIRVNLSLDGVAVAGPRGGRISGYQLKYYVKFMSQFDEVPIQR